MFTTFIISEEIARALQQKERERAQHAQSQSPSQPDRRQGQRVSHAQEPKKKPQKNDVMMEKKQY